MIWLYIILAVFFVAFLPYEIYCMVTGRPTLSRTVATWSKEYPFVAFLIGVVAGGLAIHFFTKGMQCMSGLFS